MSSRPMPADIFDLTDDERLRIRRLADADDGLSLLAAAYAAALGNVDECDALVGRMLGEIRRTRCAS